MKRSLILLLIVVTLFGQDTLRCSVGDEWYPYYFTERETLTGLDIKLTQVIFSHAQIPFQVTIVPSVRAQENLKYGTSDFLSGASFTDERNEFAHFTTPYRSEEIAILVKKGTKEKYPIHSLKEILGKDIYIAAERGAWYGDEYGKLLEDSLFLKQLKLNASLKRRIKMLYLDRVQMVIDDKNALLSTASTLNLQDSLELLPFKPYRDSVRFMFSRRSVSEELVKKISKSIDELKADSTLQKVIDDFNAGK